MFDKDFYPTPDAVIDQMLRGYDIEGKVILEPSAGKGNIVDYLKAHGARDVLACEKHPELRRLVSAKSKVLCEDFLTLTSDRVSHIHLIVMNPPFSRDEQHILHAFDIAPPGCHIVALCNKSTVDNPHTRLREQLMTTIKEYGDWQDLGNCFSTAERPTEVQVALVTLTKPGAAYDTEFEGFFLDEDPEEEQANGLIEYNVVRDLVNRYVAALKIYDEQLQVGVKMHSVLHGYYGVKLGFSCTADGAPLLRNDFKKDLQREGWQFIFRKMNLQRYATRGLKELINKFVEEQTHIPFTMRNIYRMLDIVVQTTSQRMDTALLEVFDKLTKHHADNQYNVPGWKTNSHFLVNKKFIIPNMTYQDKRYYEGNEIQCGYGSYWDFMEDLLKALCYISGDRYDTLGTLKSWISYRYKIITDDDVEYTDDKYGEVERITKKLYEKGKQYKVVSSEPIYGEWFEWAYWKCKAHKNGTMHFIFLDEDLWGRFNQRIAKLKGYPLFEYKQQTAYQDRQTGRAQQEKHDVKKDFNFTVTMTVPPVVDEVLATDPGVEEVEVEEEVPPREHILLIDENDLM
jgi:hypothetical protein